MAPNPKYWSGATKKKLDKDLAWLQQQLKLYVQQAQSRDPYSQLKAIGTVRDLVEKLKKWHDWLSEKPQISKAEYYLFKSIVPQLKDIVTFFMQLNAETEAIDFLAEIGHLEVLRLCSSISKANYRRTFLYLTILAGYLCNVVIYHQKDSIVYAEPPLRVLHDFCMKFEEYPDALRMALFLKCPKLVLDVFKSCNDGLQKKQLCYILARHGQTLVLDEEKAENDDDRLMLQGIINNEKLSEGYLTLARDMEVMEPKSPEDVYKAALVDARGSGRVHKARQNLAATYVNAFVNAGFGQDNLMTVPLDSSRDGPSEHWIFKNKGNELTCAVASLYLESDNKDVSLGALLAIGILNCHIKHEFDPINVVDILKTLSYDLDSEIAMGAVISLVLIGAGTNNARISHILHNLSSYYDEDPSLLFCISQGLLYLGKGLLTLNPYHADRFLLHQAALAGILIILHACLDMKAIIVGNYHYVLYFLVLAMQPKMLMTVDENSKPLSVPVQVGRARHVAGLPGSPRTVTGFRNQSTPVLLGPGDRAEVATAKYIAMSTILEGFVVLKENPEY